MFEESHILIVDDDKEMGELLKDFLLKENFSAQFTISGNEALTLIRQTDFDLVITDLRLDDMNGLELLKKTHEIRPNTAIIIITAFGSVESAVEAIKQGAFYYISKPFKMREILITVNMALEKRRLELENIKLRDELRRKYQFENIVGRSKRMQEVFDLMKIVANNVSNVMIYGESGTGKELVAKAIHFNSPRRDKPFIPINCTAIPEGLLESELFGHMKGAFTGAHLNKKGLFEKASGGTLFLDEIGDMGMGLQGKLLRVLQDREIRPVGSTMSTKVDVRIIAATNKDLIKEIKMKTFREDLYYRLNVIPIQLPPLRERVEDIPLLAERFLQKFQQELNGTAETIAKEAMEKLMKHSWPGNVRELENALERAVALSKHKVISLEDMPLIDGPNNDEIEQLLIDKAITLEELEKKYISKVLGQTRGRKGQAARILGIDRRTLYRKEKQYGFKC